MAKSKSFLVVYLLIPTSNHNWDILLMVPGIVVYLLIPTSNHNHQEHRANRRELYIFWFLHQTTTRNKYLLWLRRLYIFWFLHQTTTYHALQELALSCISFDSYIKPQPGAELSISSMSCISFDSYIKPQHNQLTTKN